jgi:phenylalanyl-tRNA synthetase alpha chain
MSVLEPAALRRCLHLRDLSDPAAGPHAMQSVVAALEAGLARAWGVPVRRHRGPRVVPIADHYDRLRYPVDATTRDARYTRYVDATRMLRAHTTAAIPDLLATVGTGEVLLSVPGICYRRDVIDRHHVGEPHQLDLWRIRPGGAALTGDDLMTMVGLVVSSVLPGASWHCVPSAHPYTLDGREILVRHGSGDVEIGECGLAHPELLTAAGLPVRASGLAMGLGLDRLVMLAKGIDDIRLLRSDDPRVRGQMLDLAPYRPVSAQPATRRDLSLVVAADLDAELIGDRVRAALGTDAGSVEEVLVLSETGYASLPAAARDRTGIRPGQKNMLVRLVIRDLDRTLTAAEANDRRDRVYAALHEGARSEWAGPNPEPGLSAAARSG